MSLSTLPTSTTPAPDFTDGFTQAAHIDRAADILDRDGMHRGDFFPLSIEGGRYRPGMPVCVIAALAVACGSTDPTTSAVPGPLLHVVLDRLGFVDVLQAYQWADGQTGAEVATRLRGAATAIRRAAARAALPPGRDLAPWEPVDDGLVMHFGVQHQVAKVRTWSNQHSYLFTDWVGPLRRHRHAQRPRRRVAPQRQPEPAAHGGVHELREGEHVMSAQLLDLTLALTGPPRRIVPPRVYISTTGEESVVPWYIYLDFNVSLNGDRAALTALRDAITEALDAHPDDNPAGGSGAGDPS